MFFLYKEKGMSSFDVIRKLRKKLGVKKMGHAGTLDPMAEGLLIVLVGKDETKKAQSFSGLDKEYEAVARLGQKTDTGDLEGKIMQEKNCTHINLEHVKNALEKLKGSHLWQVPIYSAVKVDGKPLYKYAREKIPVKIPEKEMIIHEIELLAFKKSAKFYEVKYRAKVSSGTYIRVLSEKLGELLECPATTTHIKRTMIGKYSLKDAKRLQDL